MQLVKRWQPLSLQWTMNAQVGSATHRAWHAARSAFPSPDAISGLVHRAFDAPGLTLTKSKCEDAAPLPAFEEYVIFCGPSLPPSSQLWSASQSLSCMQTSCGDSQLQE